MKFRITIKLIGVSAMFGLWTGSVYAALFQFLLGGFLLSMIDYAFDKRDMKRDDR